MILRSILELLFIAFFLYGLYREEDLMQWESKAAERIKRSVKK